MKDKEVKLVVGGLLHDIGKIVFREGNDRRNHCQSGYDYLINEVGMTDKEVLNCVRFHHYKLLKDAMVLPDDLAYIVYIADNIAASADRRKSDSADSGFEITVPLQSVFNVLNGNHEEKYYLPGSLNPEGMINYPQDKKIPFDEKFYREIIQRITDNLQGFEWNSEHINSLMQVLEANLSFVPSSTAKDELTDISLYDHVKLTAGFSSCIYQYLQGKQENDYRAILFQKSREFYERKVFLLCSMDLSGIQQFIYTIASENALKTLRARSFYLEIMMEHVIDCLLDRLSLSRANLIYSGGGHCYLILPNTDSARKIFEEYLEQVNEWLTELFDISLYLAGGCVPCSSNDLQNLPAGSYSALYRELGSVISKQKLHKYSAETILKLNTRKVRDYSRECRVCKRLDSVNEDGVCQICSKMSGFSKNILYSEFFTILLAESGEEGLPLPGGYFLVADNAAQVRKRMVEDPYYVRTYAKNRMYTGKHIATPIWVGDYTTGQSFQEFAEQASGIDRIGILRADVDNLGQAFVSGFRDTENADRYMTLTRVAVLSRHLSLFFKVYIRQILEQGIFHMDKTTETRKRNATIIYSGGDDVFIFGAWNDIIEFSVDLKKAFQRYTQGTLTLSAGIGIYEPGYPISAIAEEVGEQEEQSKKLPGKDAVTLMEDGQWHWDERGKHRISDGTYRWNEFEKKVLEEKYRIFCEFLFESEQQERGMNFVYHLLQLIRNQKERINFARCVYFLARLEPKEDGEKQEKYRRFSNCIYEWIQSEEDCRQLKTAICVYAYARRKTEGKNDAD